VKGLALIRRLTSVTSSNFLAKNKICGSTMAVKVFGYKKSNNNLNLPDATAIFACGTPGLVPLTPNVCKC
jgi:hypothetical protein